MASEQHFGGHVPGDFPLTPYEEAEKVPGGGAASTHNQGYLDAVTSTSTTTAAPADESTFGRDAGIIGGTTAGAGAVGYGTYAATQDVGTTSTGLHQTPIANQLDPRVNQTSTSKVETANTITSREAPAASVAPVSAVGAGAGYATTSSDVNRDIKVAEPTYTTTTTTTTTSESTKPRVVEDTHYTRDAAIVGGGTAAAAGAGYGAYEYSTQTSYPTETTALSQDTTDYKAYDHSGQGTAASERELETRFATYNLSNDANPEKTAEMKDKLKKIEAQKAATQQYTPEKERKTSSSEPRRTSWTGRRSSQTDRKASQTSATGAAAATTGATAAGAGTAAVLGSGDSGEYGPYERSGRGSVSTEGELSNRFATYELNDPNAAHTAAMKEKIRLLEAEKAKVLGVETEQQQEKKGGLLSKLRRGSKDTSGTSNTEATTATDTTTTTTGTAEGAPLTTTTSGQPIKPDTDHILVQQHADSDAPVLVVKEDPGKM